MVDLPEKSTAQESGAASPRRLSPEVAKEIRRMIMTGVVTGGQRLRTELLADHLGVSATPVREALMSLTGEGMVHFEPGRGFSVLPLKRQDILDVYDMQAYVSGELAARAVSNLQASDMERLDELQHELDVAVERGDLITAQKTDFEQHRLINTKADAPKLTWMLGLTLRYVPFESYGEIPGWPTAGREDHGPILGGLRTRSAGTARDAMRAHIRHAGDLLVDLLDEQGVLAAE
ncbi:MAG: GntR family transcriptional regulator [Kineosporiaceae bacterium]|nr:GntR family transcriptional regulator [Aeromicrobium sp.]